MRIRQLSLYTTTRCDLDCPTCGQAELRSARPDYDLGLDVVDELLDRAVELGVVFGQVCLTGGEPTLWPHFDAALEILGDEILAAEGCVESIKVLTNGRDPEAIGRHADRLKRVTVTDYPANRPGVDRLVAEFPRLVRRKRFRHRTPPQAPVPGTLPAICHCDKPGLFGRRVYTCSTSPDRLARLGVAIADPAYSADLADDWAAFLRRSRRGRFNRPVCRVCVSNAKVWRTLKR